MDWQQFASLGLVAGAVGLLAWSKIRRRRRPGFLHTLSCGFGAGSAASRPPSIILHARKGQRPEVIVKMK